MQETQNRTPSRSLLSEAMIPISIVIAGIFIGAGLYFSGGVGSGTTATGAQPAPLAAEQPAPQPTTNTDAVATVTSADHIKGSVDAPIKIVEFSDYDCPFCSRFHDTMNAVIDTYSEDEVAWVFRQFPLEQLHPQAPLVAAASECVAELGGNDAFWSFTDEYFALRGAGDTTAHATLLPQLAVQAGVSQAAFATCIESERHAAAVQEDFNNAVETGGRGTPWSILIGPSGKTYPINGSVPRQTLEQLIEQAKRDA